jgi:hypothetical protein
MADRRDRPFLTKDLGIWRVVIEMMARVEAKFVGQIPVHRTRRLRNRQRASARQFPQGLYSNRLLILVWWICLQFSPPCAWQLAACEVAIAPLLVQYCSAELEVLAAIQSPMVSLVVRNAPNIAHRFSLIEHHHGLQAVEERLVHVDNQSDVRCRQFIDTIKPFKLPNHADIDVRPVKRHAVDRSM